MHDPHVWYYKVEFSGLVDHVDLLPVEPNPRGAARHLGKFRMNRPIS